MERRRASLRLPWVAATALLLAACGLVDHSPSGSTAATASIVPSGAAPTASPGATPGRTAASTPAGSPGIPQLLANVPGFVVEPMDPSVLDLVAAAASASLREDGELGDAVGVRAVRDGDGVDVIAFTLVPAAGVTENTALFYVMDGVAEGAGGEWVPDEEAGWFELDQSTGHALLVPWGNVPGATVFLLVVGPDEAIVEAAATAVLSREG